MVTISGRLIQRTARPHNSSTAPPASLSAASQASSSGNGRPSPQSGLPNHSMVAGMSASFWLPAIQNTGARYRRSASGREIRSTGDVEGML